MDRGFLRMAKLFEIVDTKMVSEASEYTELSYRDYKEHNIQNASTYQSELQYKNIPRVIRGPFDWSAK